MSSNFPNNNEMSAEGNFLNNNNQNQDEKLYVSGRDDSLLKILAKQMNFTVKYVDVMKAFPFDNETQPSELGLKMIYQRVK
jgi:hypothetical protein